MSEQIEYKEIHIRSLSDVPSKGAWLASLPNGAKCWFADGKLHRLDGPAVEWVDGTIEFYIDGKKYSKQDYWITVNGMKGELEKIRHEYKQEIEQLQKRIIKLQAHNDLLARRLQKLAMMMLEEKIND